MTRDDALKFIPIIEAYARGETIQGRVNGGGWFDYTIPYLSFDGAVGDYRVKPKKVQKKRWFRTYREGDEIKILNLSLIPANETLCTVYSFPDPDWVGEWNFIIVEVEEEA